MDRHADRPSLIRNGAGNRLTNPPGRVGTELESPAIIKFLHGPDQTEVPLLDQVQKEHSAPDVLLRDADHQAEVRVDELLLRLDVPLLHALGQVDLLLRPQKGDFSDLAQIHAHRIRQRDIVQLAEIPVQGREQLLPNPDRGMDLTPGLLLNDLYSQLLKVAQDVVQRIRVPNLHRNMPLDIAMRDKATSLPLMNKGPHLSQVFGRIALCRSDPDIALVFFLHRT